MGIHNILTALGCSEAYMLFTVVSCITSYSSPVVEYGIITRQRLVAQCSDKC